MPFTTSPFTSVEVDPGLADQPWGQLTAAPQVTVLAYTASQQATLASVSVMPVMLMLDGAGEAFSVKPLLRLQTNDVTLPPGLVFAHVAPCL